MLRATPPGEDGVKRPFDADSTDSYEDGFQYEGEDGFGEDGDDDGLEFDEQPTDAEFLQMVGEADQQALQYVNQVNRESWLRGYRAYHQEHADGSKYRSTDYNNRSRLFIPKTRTSVRKDMAATAASMFGTLDAVNAMPGNEGDDKQRASAAVLKEILNYRTDRANNKASIPWFHVVMGARQTSLITGICLSKQYWKLELARDKQQEEYEDEETGEKKLRDVWKPKIDRPESELIAPENFTMDPAADWTNPAQDAAYVIIKWPMRIDEIRRRQRDPRNPWRNISEDMLLSSGEGAQMQMESIRRAREQGLDRFDRSQTTRHFDVIWVWESYIRTAGEDWTFFSLGEKVLLTDPKPVSEVYPEQFGERPLSLGYGSLEAFRIFPMSNVESWQSLQQEANDIRNLSLDALKQNIMPVTKVIRGRNVDLEQLRRRGTGTAIMVTDKDDVTWEKTPDLSNGTMAMKQALDVEFDDLSGQQNYGTVEQNNALGKTLGGLKLAAGAANAVQEYDIRVWIETWAEPVLNQLARLIQFYESDPVILGLCGDRAKLFQKFGISEISDELLENNITVRVNVGLGAGDPQQRLQKFASAMQVAGPLLAQSPDFQKQKVTVDWEAIMDEVFGAAGYRDGGRRFVKPGEGQGQDPMRDPQIEKLKSEAAKNYAMAKKAMLDALSNAAEIGIQISNEERQKAIELFDLHYRHAEQIGKAQDMGHKHGMEVQDRQMAARGLLPNGTPLLPPSGPSPAEGGGEGGAPPASAGFAAGGSSGAPPEQSEAPVKKKRRVAITKRGPDGRASEFSVTDD
jgi:hypothetical protein